jgi:hypothetical protein
VLQRHKDRVEPRIEQVVSGRAIVRGEDQVAAGLHHPSHLAHAARGQVEPGNDAQRDDDVEDVVAERKFMDVAGGDSHALAEVELVGALSRQSNHRFRGVDCIHSIAASRKRRGHGAGTPPHLEDAHLCRQLELVYPCQEKSRRSLKIAPQALGST